MDKTLTISVAAYNVETYLEKLFSTVLLDDILEDIEVLVINDGSSDRTADIAAEYEKKYPGVVFLVNKENGGHGSTINKGIELAKGKYFRALDGDDWVDSEALVRIIRCLKKTEADLVLAAYRECYEDGKVTMLRLPLKHGVTYPFDEISDQFKWLKYHTVIYKTELFRAHKVQPLDEKCFYVDSEFMLFPLVYVETAAYFDLPLYSYRLGLQGQSVSFEGKKKHIGDSKRVVARMLDFYEQLPEGLSDARRRIVVSEVSRHCNWHFRVLSEFEPTAANRSELKSFDQMLKNRVPVIYNNMLNHGNESRLTKVMRKTHYHAYYPIAIYKNVKRML